MTYSITGFILRKGEALNALSIVLSGDCISNSISVKSLQNLEVTYETEFSKRSLDRAYYRMGCAWGRLMRHNFCDNIYAWTVAIRHPQLE